MYKMDEEALNELDKVKEERDFYKKIVDTIPAVVHINNLKKEYVEWINPTGQKFSGYDEKTMLKNKGFLQNTVIPEDLDWLADSIVSVESLNENEIRSYIYSMKHADGSIGSYHGFTVPFKKNDKGEVVLNLCVDFNITHEISNYKQLKRQVDQLSMRLNKSILKSITRAEKEIIKLLAQGLTIKEIATKTNRSFHTIDKHKRNIFFKLKINKLTELIRMAGEIGLV